MSEPLHIPLSAHQVARFAALGTEGKTLNAAIKAFNDRLNEGVTAIIAGVVDPASLEGWDIKQVGAEIVCTPPAAPVAE